MAVAVPVEISAAQILLGYWDTNSKHIPLYTAAIIVAVWGINTLGVRWFGECMSTSKCFLVDYIDSFAAEFIFSLIKRAWTV